ncbi:MAG: ABC transporter permease [Peptoniphilaceae bacterium]
MNGVIKLSLVQMSLAYVFVLILLFIVKKRGISREKEIIISSIRMTLQLVLTGYLLVFLFKNPSPIFTILVLIAMELFAIYTIINRVKSKISKKQKRIIAISISSATVSTLLYFLLVVIRISPWYDPQYFIPLAGMLIGNSMTGISLGVNILNSDMKAKKDLIEEYLIIGASPKEATKDILDHAFDSAILPTINSMLGMGIVFLPGMMTGQILSGISPITAIEYQIAIMLGILGSVSISVIIFIELAYKSFFNQDAQLVFEED